jgi:factor associated with neutral sphingomyelinase activation
LKELTPNFYAGGYEALINLEGMEFGGEEVAKDVDLPPWAADSQQFCEIMREALESDVVS